MCGIWGTYVTGKNGLYAPTKNFVFDSMLAGAVRGNHGTGLMFSPANDTHLIATFKRHGNPYWILADKNFPEYAKVMEATAKYVVGHNRYATRGEHSEENAHPFNHKHITMVHNGTINSGLRYPPGVEVDSEALTIALAENGLDIFSKIYGAFACVWHDADKKTLNIAKNHERPLHMVKANGDYFFASEEEMLKWIVKRSHRNYTNLIITNVPIENNKLYSFNLDQFGEPEVTPLPEKKIYQVPATTHISKIGWRSGECGDFSERETTHKKGETKTKKSNDNLIRFNIVKKTLQYLGQQELWLYFGKSLNNEAVWFQSKDDFPIGETLYEAEIVAYQQNAYDYFGENAMWYKVKPRSILIIDELKELEKELEEEQNSFKMKTNYKCVECETRIDVNELKDCIPMSVSTNVHQYLCPICTKDFILNKERILQ